MRIIFLIISSAAFFCPFSTLLQAQVEIDRPLHLTGGAGESRITGLNDPPTLGTDAVNKEYVDERTYAHKVGDLYGGGIIAALWEEGGEERGLVVSLLDLSAATEWSGNTTNAVGATAQSFSQGSNNTSAIIAQGGGGNTPGKAATLCDDYTNTETGTGVFSDWYLPSAYELQLCYNAAFVINTILGDSNGFQPGYYWSSTEGNANNAFNKWFSNGTSYNTSKSSAYRVRAVRRF